PRAGCSSRFRPTRGSRLRRSSGRAGSTLHGSAPSRTARASPSGRELAPARDDPLALVGELGLELVELVLAAADECELRFDVRERRLEDAEPLRVRLRRVELPAQRGARLL